MASSSLAATGSPSDDIASKRELLRQAAASSVRSSSVDKATGMSALMGYSLMHRNFFILIKLISLFMRRTLGETKDQLRNRGEKLDQLSDKTAKMAMNANKFAELAKQLNKEKQSSWW